MPRCIVGVTHRKKQYLKNISRSRIIGITNTMLICLALLGGSTVQDTVKSREQNTIGTKGSLDGTKLCSEEKSIWNTWKYVTHIKKWAGGWKIPKRSDGTAEHKTFSFERYNPFNSLTRQEREK